MAREILHTAEDFYILATSSSADRKTRVLKHDDTFAVFNALGDIGTPGIPDDGLYNRDTRFLSLMTVRIGDLRPVLLSSTVRKDNALLTVDLTNADVTVGEVVAAPRGMLHVFRSKLLWRGACYERMRVHNYGHLPIRLPLDINFACDFADIFEVRGMERAARGHIAEPVYAEGTLAFGYEGLDGRVRQTRIVFDPRPASVDEGHVRFDMRISPGEAAIYALTTHCEIDEPIGRVSGIGFDAAMGKACSTLRGTAEEPEIHTGHELFDQWIERSLADLRMLQTETQYGPYVYAGVPWFSTVFGRDGIITALETLWFNPSFARGVLSYLAATQADDDSPAHDAQPGKILHETREGEMAATGEVPFGRYYGSIDATPLFVMLAGAYYERTGDGSFAHHLWPHVERALMWMDRYGDFDGDSFLEYAVRAEGGLVHQGWKDSSDPVFHADGTLAEAPIALCEVQGYAYAARRGGSLLATVVGQPERAAALESEADELREKFQSVFWCEDLDTYALALDGDKELCRVRTSNAGHCLYTGIAHEEHAARIAALLTSDAFFSGWGVRTVATTESRYNPMSYHNGSVWPHDSAMIASGLARYGHTNEAIKILEALFHATLSFDLRRLPELFCGFHRREYEDPTRYPVACLPQAWASGAVLMLLQACLGLEVRGGEGEVRLMRPQLPDFLPYLDVKGLRVGDGTVAFRLARHDGGLRVDVSPCARDVQVTISQ